MIKLRVCMAGINTKNEKNEYIKFSKNLYI